MTPHRLMPRLLGTAAALSLALSAAAAHAVTEFNVTNLVSDGIVPANTIDPLLVNPWGVSFGPTTPFWISDNQTHVTTLYNGAGAKIAALPQVAIPPVGASAPTGQVFNNGLAAGAFSIAGQTPVFLFDGEDGHISGWAPAFGTTAAIGATTQVGAIYKGLAIGADATGQHLYATDFHNGDVEMYTNTLSGFTTFTDPTVATGYAPFNARVLGGKLYVTFALQDADATDDVGGPGHGYVDVFNLDGTLDHRLVSLGGQIDSPWGLAIAPSSFGEFAGSLLVGNFGDGTISAFNISSGAFLGKLLGRDHNPLQFDDLWALTPGNGAAAGSTQNIYLTAGMGGESHGLFAQLSAAPEPASWALMLTGFGLLGAVLRGRARAAREVTTAG